MSTVQKEYIAINSADRNLAKYPCSNHYKIELQSLGLEWLNVVSINLHAAVLPDLECVAKQPYVLLHIDELGGRSFKGSNTALSDAFAFIQMDKGVGSGWINAKPEFNRGMLLDSVHFNYPKFNAFTITLTDPHGNRLALPCEQDSTDPRYQHTLILQVDKKRIFLSK